MSGGSRRSGACLRCCFAAFAVVLTLCLFGPTLYWRFEKGIRLGHDTAASSCDPCICDCPPPLSLINISPGLVNHSVTDCGGDDPDLKNEMEKQFVDLLSEELRLQDSVAQEHAHHMNISFLEARRAASQYQREAEKCNAATEICEGARERAQALLIREKKMSSLWERRALEMGWNGE